MGCPKKISRLANLRTLSNFVVGKKKSGSTVEKLEGLSSLHRALRISMLQNVVSAKEAAAANLVGKKNDELVLEWDYDTVDLKNDREVCSKS